MKPSRESLAHRRYASASGPRGGHARHTDYSQVIKSYVLSKYQKVVDAFIPNLNERDKKGMRILEAVYNCRGEKKFKKRPEERVNQMLDFKKMTYEEAHKTFQSMNNRSHYDLTYGRQPLAHEDGKILKYKNI